MPLAWSLGLAVLVAALVAGATGLVLGALTRRRILDHPNARSSHDRPTPRGGGIALIGVVLVVWAALALLLPGAPAALPWIVGGGLLLALVSWRDDLRSLPALPRLLAQIAAVAIGLAAFDDGALVFQGVLPLWADRLAAGLLWLWFVNLFNFMDGIDGLTGAQTAAVALGLVVLALLGAGDPAGGALALALAGAALGFLCWNWHPARIFLGDVGSVPLGFLLGWLLLALAAAGQPAAALILPLYYLADASLTLARRLLRGERVWQAHREHYYQKAVQAGRSHAEVVRLVLLADALLIGLAVVSVERPWTALAAAAIVAAGLLAILTRRRPGAAQ